MSHIPPGRDFRKSLVQQLFTIIPGILQSAFNGAGRKLLGFYAENIVAVMHIYIPAVYSGQVLQYRSGLINQFGVMQIGFEDEDIHGFWSPVGTLQRSDRYFLGDVII